MTTENQYKKGSVKEFDSSWTNLPKNARYHFKRNEPENQVQYAFQNHWRVFREIIGDIPNGRALEVGCGRGSMAAFFADHDYDTFLLDTSHAALKIAEVNFAADDLNGFPVVGDALLLPYQDDVFDVVLSIGLFEHFSDIEAPLEEQLRILKKGGYFLGYVVPERAISVQLLGAPVNGLLRLEYLLKNIGNADSSRAVKKEELFRNSFSIHDYLEILEGIGAEESGGFGMFPVPLISHSYKFPFSVMSPKREGALIKIWDTLLKSRFWRTGDPWTCPERWGLAFLVWAKK